MTSEIFISFFIAISLIQISVAEDPPSSPPPTPSSSTPTNEAGHSSTSAKPQAILPVVADNVWYYGGMFGNFMRSFIDGDEWSVKYLLYQLLEGTKMLGSAVAQVAGTFQSSPYITIHSGSSAADTTGNKEAGTNKPAEAQTLPIS